MKQSGASSTVTFSPDTPKSDDQGPKQGPDVPATIMAQTQVPDGGYGWVIVFAGFMCNFIVDGIANSFGVIIPKYVEAFDSDMSSVSWAGSLLVGVTLSVGPIVGAMTNHFGCRAVCISGSIVAATGLVLSSFTTTLDMFILTFGVIGGIGYGMIFLPSIVCVGYYFEKKRSMATGIAVCGTGVGTFILAPVVKYLLEITDWKQVNLIFAGLTLFGIVCGLLMRPLVLQPIEEGRVVDIQQNQKSGKDVDLPVGDAMSKNEFPSSSPPGQSSVEKSVAKSDYMAPDDSGINSPASTLISGGGAIDEQSLLTMMTDDEAAAAAAAAGPDDDDDDNDQDDQDSDTSSIDDDDDNDEKQPPTEYIRPMAKKHVFYTGSLENVPEYREDQKSIVPSISIHYKKPRTISISKKSGKRTSCGRRRARCLRKCTKKCRRTLSTRGCRRRFGKGASTFRTTFAEMMDFSLMKNPLFVLMALSNVFGMLAFYIPLVYVVNAAVVKGIEENQATILLSILGVANTFGRLATGMLSDRPDTNSLLLYSICVLVSGLMTACIPFCTEYFHFIVVLVFFGLFISGFISLTSIILVDLLGLEKLTNAFGLVILFRGFAAILGAPLAGALYVAFGSYDVPFWVAGGFFVLSSGVSFLVPCVKRRKMKRDADNAMKQLVEVEAPASSLQMVDSGSVSVI